MLRTRLDTGQATDITKNDKLQTLLRDRDSAAVEGVDPQSFDRALTTNL